MAMATPSPQQRAETPPPRRRGTAGNFEDHAAQQQVWSAKPGSESDDWTSSPLPRPRETLLLKETKDDSILSPKAKVVNFVPEKVNEDGCFTSPTRSRGHGFELHSEPGLFTSPKPAIPGKENRQPGQTLRTPMKTPSRLPTVQEHDGLVPPVDEHNVVSLPAWMAQTPTPAVPEELAMAARDLTLSPPPPGLEDVKCDLPQPTVKSTFLQFVSPLKTFSLMSPPKTEPVNFAPAASAVASLFSDMDGMHDAMSHSPMPWATHEQIPFFPAHTTATASMPLPADLEPVSEPRQKGPVVRLAEFLPDPPSCQPSVVDQAFWSMPSVTSLTAPPMMTGTDLSMQFATGLEGMTAPSSYSCPTLAMVPDAMQQQWHIPQQLHQGSLQTQQMTLPLLPSPPMHPTEGIHQLPEAHLQQPQAQLQPPPLHSHLLQPPPMMPPPQMQAPTLQSPQLQPPLTQAMSPSMQTEQMFLQQLMQLQMQPPTWPPLQPPQLVAGENVPAPPPQAPMEAPSALCPSACHLAGVCRCGEGSLFMSMTSPSTSCAKSDEQPSAGSGTTAPILLSAAMFPEMGSTSAANSSRQRL
jgi:hypothetical protein